MQKRSVSIWAMIALVLFIPCVLTACAIQPKPKPAVSSSLATSAPVRGIRAGQLAPDFSLTSVRGTQISLSQYRGQPVIVTFFATWCTPCRLDMPGIENVYKRYWDQGLAIIAVDLGDDPRLVSRFGSDLDLTFPLMLDRDEGVGNMYQVSSIPRSFYIDPNGIIRRMIIGYVDESEIASTVDVLFQYAVASQDLPPAEDPIVSPTEEPAAGHAAEPVKQKLLAEQTVNGCVNIGSALVRSGPGKNFQAVYSMGMGKCTAFDAQNVDGSWLRLADGASDGSALWITTSYITLDDDISQLPVGK